MATLVGIDEAGYGPKLGPLVVTAAVFSSKDPHANLWESLADAVTDGPGAPGRLLVADSKKVYKRSQEGLARLEEAALSFLAVFGESPSTFLGLLRALSVPPQEGALTCPWYDHLDVSLPIHPRGADIAQRALSLRKTMEGQPVSFRRFISRLYRVREFNEELHRTGNKARLLFSACADLIHSALADGDESEFIIDVDRHGGRWYYGRLLAGAFPFTEVRPLVESPTHSRYSVNLLDRKVRISFTVRADSLSLPVALASMVCKYVREVHMAAFNDWWTQLVPGLKGTAGYHVDANRFLEDIEPSIQNAGIDRLALVRQR